MVYFNSCYDDSEKSILDYPEDGTESYIRFKSTDFNDALQRMLQCVDKLGLDRKNVIVIAWGQPIPSENNTTPISTLLSITRYDPKTDDWTYTF